MKSRRRPDAQKDTTIQQSLIDAWRTNNRVTTYLVEHFPASLWATPVPAASNRPVRMILGHLHNSRSRWLKTLGGRHGIEAPPLVDLRKVSRTELVAALKNSGAGMEALIALGLRSGGRVPESAAYVWRNLPLDVGHVLTYFVAHEAHHRGQLVMLARQLGHRLPSDVTNGLWQWTTRSREWQRTR
jgi:uncharacterized damage-inducible protein DinB